MQSHSAAAVPHEEHGAVVHFGPSKPLTPTNLLSITRSATFSNPLLNLFAPYLCIRRGKYCMASHAICTRLILKFSPAWLPGTHLSGLGYGTQPMTVRASIPSILSSSCPANNPRNVSVNCLVILATIFHLLCRPLSHCRLGGRVPR